jgi:two-component system cell cycle sensor histidine kinase/response regulator CckA
VTSEVGRGTTFFVYLPAAEAPEEREELSLVSTAVRKGKILVMDDEDLVRNIAGELLKSLGHEADFADRGEVAIAKYSAALDSGKPFDVVILDLTVRGGLGGRDTMERLRAIDPQVKAIVSSGYSNDHALSKFQKYGFVACLTKPYRLEELRETLGKALAD